MLVAALSAWAQTTVRIAKRNPAFRILFNIAALILTVQAAGWVFFALGGQVGVFDAGLVKPLVGAALAYYLVNTATVASAVGLSTGQQTWKVWHSNFLWTAPSYFVGAGAAAAAAWAWSTGWGWLVPLAAAPVYLTFRSYTVYLERIAAEQRHHEEMVKLHAQTVDALTAAKESEQRYALAAAGSNDGLWDWDLSADAFYASDRWKLMVGLPAESPFDPRRGLVPPRPSGRPRGSAPRARSPPRRRDGALRARVPDVAPRRPRPLDAVPRRRGAGRVVAPGSYRRDRRPTSPSGAGSRTSSSHAALHDNLTGPRQPRAVHRAARARARQGAPVAGLHLRGAVRRPRPLQADQRQPRPHRRRSVPRGDRQAPGAEPAADRRDGAPRRRRVRDPARGHQRSARGDGGRRAAPGVAAAAVRDRGPRGLRRRRAWASRSATRNTAAPTTCCATPTPRCIAPRRRGAARTRRSIRRCTRRRSSG